MEFVRYVIKVGKKYYYFNDFATEAADYWVTDIMDAQLFKTKDHAEMYAEDLPKWAKIIELKITIVQKEV